jgi:hypothetical protein
MKVIFEFEGDNLQWKTGKGCYTFLRKILWRNGHVQKAIPISWKIRIKS